jgi:hypothetical protein
LLVAEDVFRPGKPCGVVEGANVKCVSFGSFKLSQVSVDPQRAQNPRRVPGEESNFAISPLVTV